MLIGVIENHHFAFFPGSRIASHPQERLFGHEKREVAPELQVAGTIVRSDGSLGRHRREESVAERRTGHQLRAQALVEQLVRHRAMLLKQFFVRSAASLDIVHPLPGAFVQSVLTVLLRIVVSALTVSLAQLPVLFLHRLQIALEVRSEAEILRPVERLCVEAGEEEETWGWTMVRCRPEHLAGEELGSLLRCGCLTHMAGYPSLEFN